ncbi:MAG TPA: glycosyltransferase [Methylotenera sp.]|nr:glycosyltransferase [Methylotenera sp.]HPH06119.1 glycosyltransferase [Methylotenera sp.]HPN00324.1 glycosyltransferase [Methylotenera sp.]
MRVCILYPHVHGGEGYPRDIYRLYTELIKDKTHEVVLCPQSKDISISGRMGFDEIALIAPLKELLPKVDVVHIFGFFFPLYPLLIHLIRKSGKPYILSPLGQLEPRALTISSKKKSVFINTLGKWMLSNAKFIHSFSESETESILNISPNVMVKEAPLGIYYEDIPTQIKQSKLRPISEYFLFFGRLGYFHKGIDVLLDGYAKYLKNGGITLLVVAGKSWQGSHEIIKQKIEELGIGDKAHFLGEVSLEEKYALIKECKAFVYPSRYDGPPRPIREALALHKPLLVSRQANIISNLESLGWGYTFDPEPTELAKVMCHMDIDYAVNSYEDPSEILSWDKVVGMYSKMYEIA